MYCLWRNKPHAVLSQKGTWIPKKEIASHLDEIQFFDNIGEARHLQRSKYSKCGVSVLNQKSFKEKANIKKLPVFKATPAINQANDLATPTLDVLDRQYVYGEYLEKLCDGDCEHRSRVIFPPSNLEHTVQTPNLLKTSAILEKLVGHLAELEEKEQQLRDEIRQLDLLNSDRLHQAEMFDLTNEECVLFVHALHDAQLERRKRKNELSAILVEKQVLQGLDKGELKKAINMIKNLGRQEYHCRVLPETDPIVVNHK